MQRVAYAQRAADLFGSNASVGREAIKMIEAFARRPPRQVGFTEFTEPFLKTIQVDAGKRMTRRNRAARARITPLKLNFADREAHDVALVFGEELILPKRGNVVDFEGGAKTHAHFVERDFGKPLTHLLQRGGRRDGRTVGNRIVGKTFRGITDQNLLLEVDAEPFRSFIVLIGEREGARWQTAAIVGRGKSDGG